MNNSPPWSRLACTQPDKRAVSPESEARNAPQVCERYGCMKGQSCYSGRTWPPERRRKDRGPCKVKQARSPSDRGDRSNRLKGRAPPWTRQEALPPGPPAKG